MSEEPGPVVCFGEVLLRLAAAPGVPLASASSLDLVVGGAEANVAAALAGLGVSARMLTCLPDNPLGRRAIAAIRSAGVDTRHAVSVPGRIGLYFYEPPAGPNPGRVTYDRDGSAFGLASPAVLPIAEALTGARLLHMSGITPALGPGGTALARAVIGAAREAGVPVSFDGNYRANLWSAWDSDPRTILAELVGGAQVMFGNHRDISLLLGRTFSGDGPDRRREAVEAAFAAFPDLALIASTARRVESGGIHHIAARVDMRDDHWQTAEIKVENIVDRIGTGDAFAAGVLHAYLSGEGVREAAHSGLALAAMKHGVAGDQIVVTAGELAAFNHDVGDIRR